jgi:hypothetical protein
MLTFYQSSGECYLFGRLLAKGWAGQGEGYNNPDMQGISNIGPLPRGFYTIGPSYHHPELGPVVMNLTPDPANEMFGRSLFRIHGASAAHPELSSKGCIVLPREARDRIHLSYETRLGVKE